MMGKHPGIMESPVGFGIKVEFKAWLYSLTSYACLGRLLKLLGLLLPLLHSGNDNTYIKWTLCFMK
jgi:hypothetical protein